MTLLFMPISPQLQQGLVNLVYFTWLHNAEAIAYFVGCALTLYLQLKKPNRIYLLFFIGFLLLLLQFQYVKHIVVPLQEQTLHAVLQQGAQGLRFSKITSLFLNKVIPIGLYLTGWGTIFFAIVKSTKTADKKK
jgi:hypothetical protein